ncbi:MAG: ABC transporter ATP-binding protein [Candidatus Eremiobacteraeota bacterium]|nr:ABC transporter ATP-binding protein [Candidatus Eremiobacteraeota bacterium]
MEALKDISLSIESGDIIGILGRSGSGKTTLLNLLAFLDRPSSGTITLKGREIRTENPALLARERREHIGFIFQQFNLIAHLTAAENVALPLKYCGIPRRKRMERACEMLEMVGMGHRTDFRWGELSGGEAQRVAVARALINRPSLLFADEPTSELDNENSEILHRLIANLAGTMGAAVVIATHDPAIATCTTRLFTINDGTLESGQG